jgi:hypothetical protein
MALDFPDSPDPDDIYTEAGRTWKWNGDAWDILGEFPVPIGLEWEVVGFDGGDPDPEEGDPVDGYIELRAELPDALPVAVYENKRANINALVTLAGDIAPTITGWRITTTNGTPKRLFLVINISPMDLTGNWEDDQTVELNAGWLDWDTTGGIGSDGHTFLPAGPLVFLASNPE